ncbi:hypothetical protein [Ornithinibacillus xuwenensis]|uniref:Phage gp6-like head-tail connector protein n=1 Tax=Ornithinibacillus xuwenensis TaxID=3144668 RepID=A0ABU9XDQ6_9BACI
MTTEQLNNLIIECKKGLGISIEPNEAIDGVVKQKILIIVAYMKGSGVNDETIAENDLSTGVIVLGVTDLWNLNSGEVKFSPVFNTLLTQLAAG